MVVENSILVRLRIQRTGQHTCPKNFYEYLVELAVADRDSKNAGVYFFLFVSSPNGR